MLHRYTAFVLLSGIAFAAFAQPTIPSGNSSFLPGETYTLHQGDYFTPPATGVANATWDHSDFTILSTVEDAWVAPTPTAPAGPTVSEMLGPGVYGHYKATPTTFEQMGLTTPQATLSCSNGITVIGYPFTFGSEVNDTYVCSGSNAGENFNRTGTIDLNGASWGTLVLPYGTFTNVLMIDLEQHHEDVFVSDPEFPIAYNAFSQLFVKPGVKHPLLANYEVYTVPGQLFFYSRMLDGGDVGVEEALRNTIGLDLLPNPARGQVEVIFGTGASQSTLKVIDVTGKVCLQRTRGGQGAGIQREVLDLSTLPSGAYSVRITDATGAMGTKRLIVQ
ncbi:MAG: T9SS type A sorting domain-containing protein [Flavobacteriales bacterium]